MILAYMFLVLLDRHRDVYSALTLAAFFILVDITAPTLLCIFPAFFSGGLGIGLSLAAFNAAMETVALSP